MGKPHPIGKSSGPGLLSSQLSNQFVSFDETANLLVLGTAVNRNSAAMCDSRGQSLQRAVLRGKLPCGVREQETNSRQGTNT